MAISMSFVQSSQSTIQNQNTQPVVPAASVTMTTAEGFFNVRVYDENGKAISGNIPVLGQDVTPYEWGAKRMSELKEELSKNIHNGVLQRIKMYIDAKNFEKELPMGTWEVPFMCNVEENPQKDPTWEERWIVVKVFFHINTKKYPEAAMNKASLVSLSYKK